MGSLHRFSWEEILSRFLVSTFRTIPIENILICLFMISRYNCQCWFYNPWLWNKDIPRTLSKESIGDFEKLFHWTWTLFKLHKLIFETWRLLMCLVDNTGVEPFEMDKISFVNLKSYGCNKILSKNKMQHWKFITKINLKEDKDWNLIRDRWYSIGQTLLL